MSESRQPQASLDVADSDQRRKRKRRQQALQGGARYGRSRPTRDEYQRDDGPSDAPNECANCGAHVDADYQRVMSAPDGTVHRCPECSEKTDRIEGAVAGVEPRIDRYGGDWP